MILPNNNISIIDVRNCLGYPSMDLGTLCMANTINPYSMWKPVISSALTSDYNTMKNANFGFSDANSSTDLAQRRWTYHPPTGGALSPYRLGDFRNYNSDKTVTNFVNVNLPSSLQPNGLNDMNCSIRWDETSTLLGAKSVYYNSEYLGVRLKSLTNSSIYYCTFKRPTGTLPLFLTDNVLNWNNIGKNVELTLYVTNRIIGASGDIYNGRWIQSTDSSNVFYPVINASNQIITKSYTLEYLPNNISNNVYTSLLNADPYTIQGTADSTTVRYTFQLNDKASLGLSRLRSLTSTFVIQRETGVAVEDYSNAGTTSASTVYITQADTNLYNYTFIIPVGSRGEKVYLSIYQNLNTHTNVERLQRFEISYI